MNKSLQFVLPQVRSLYYNNFIKHKVYMNDFCMFPLCPFP